MGLLDIIKDTLEQRKCPECGLPLVAVARPVGREWKTVKDRHGSHCESSGGYEDVEVCTCGGGVIASCERCRVEREDLETLEADGAVTAWERERLHELQMKHGCIGEYKGGAAERIRTWVCTHKKKG